MSKSEIIYLLIERHHAELVSRYATFSLVRYTRNGHDFEVIVDNDEYEFTEGEETIGDDTQD